MAVIALYGGSFNPTHDGHIHVGHTARRLLGCDQVWMMMAAGNPLKDPNKYQYADIDHRMNMAKIAIGDRAKDWLIPTDIERELGLNQTAHVLAHLRNAHPEHKFIWVMGADNLTNFHKWGDWQDIMDNHPILILGRSGENEGAINSPVARNMAHIRLDNTQLLKYAAHGWCFFDRYEEMGLSASGILKSLRAGQRHISGLKPAVESYILQNRLYGLSHPAAMNRPPRPRGPKPF